MRKRLQENTGRVIALALAFFGGLAALGYLNGLHHRLGAELTATLVLFTLAFAALTWHSDPGVRAFMKRLVMPRATVAKRADDRAATPT